MRRFLPPLPVLILLAVPCAADYVVFQDGRHLKVEGWRFEDGETVVELPGGGAMRFTAQVVRYVAPDEDVEAQPVPAALTPPGEPWLAFADPRFVEPIRLAATRHQVDPALVAAVIKVESDFRPHAVSPKGAQGLMQLMPLTARERGVADPFDAAANIEGGTSHLGRLLERYAGDIPLALAAYNAGEGAVARSGGIPPYPETRRYVERVLSLASRPID